MTQESSGTIGSNITLDINGTTHTFTICGILNIPCAQGSYTFLLSQETLMALPGAVQAGYQASVCLSGGKELDQVQAKQILEPITEELGLSQPALNMQALADANTPSSESVLLLPLLGALILIGGGVVIRSIFKYRSITKSGCMGSCVPLALHAGKSVIWCAGREHIWRLRVFRPA